VCRRRGGKERVAERWVWSVSVTYFFSGKDARSVQVGGWGRRIGREVNRI
jgi:hypothetical protein